MSISSLLRAELVAHPSWVSDNATLTQFCDAFGDSLPGSIMDDRWDDIQGQIATGLKTAALTEEVYRATPFVMSFFRHNQDDAISFVYQMPHSWKVGSDVNPHLHYVAMSAPAAPEDVYFSYAYTWKHMNEAIPDVGSWTTGNLAVEVVAADEFIHKVVGFGPITPPAAAHESSVLLFYLARLGTDILDTYTTGKALGTAAANLGLVSADCHIQKLATGTVTEIPP